MNVCVTPESDGALPDVRAFQDALAAARIPGAEGGPTFFEPKRAIFVGRAPGRLDVMGGIADYSGSLVLQWPIREATRVALQRVPGRTVRILSRSGMLQPCGSSAPADPEVEGVRAVVLDLDAILVRGASNDPYASVRRYFVDRPADRWAAYVAGAFAVLTHERGLKLAEGANILVESEVPEAVGVSSSAALEVATMRAVAAAYALRLDPSDLARLCQVVENQVVGAPCGIMDQMTCALGRPGHFLALLCQPAEVQGWLPLPNVLAVWGIDSGERHSVAGHPYRRVRVGAFMGYRIIADLAGLLVDPADGGQRIQVRDPRWGGYLANITVGEFEAAFAARLPEELAGRDFLERYSGTTDCATTIDPAACYPVRYATRHPVYEHDRVRRFRELITNPDVMAHGVELGELMYASHASYSACGLGAPGPDRLVELVRSIGPAGGLFGAKITGGGSGGTVAVLGRADAGPAIAEVATRYAGPTGPPPTVFSSPGGTC